MEIGRAEFFPYSQPAQTIVASSTPKDVVLMGEHNTIDELKRQLADLAGRVEKAEHRLDHVEPTVEGLDQTVRDIARQSDVEMWDE